MLFEQDEDHREAIRFPDGRVVVRRPHSNAAALLAGLALENMMKAILVTEDPSFVAEGTVRRLKSHSIEALANQSKRVAFSPSEQELCRFLSTAIPVWGRYPVPLHAAQLSDAGLFDEARFDAFKRLYDRLWIELEQILGNDWPGPHGMHVSSGTLKP